MGIRKVTAVVNESGQHPRFLTSLGVAYQTPITKHAQHGKLQHTAISDCMSKHKKVRGGEGWQGTERRVYRVLTLDLRSAPVRW